MDRAVVDLAMEEAKRFIRVKSYPLVEDIPKPELAPKRTIGKVLEAAARDLPPLDKCQVSHETAVALAARRETGPAKIPLGKVKKQGKGKGKGTKRKEPEIDTSAELLCITIGDSDGTMEVKNGQEGREDQGSRKKQKKLYTAKNEEVVLVKHLPTIAELGRYEDEEWL